jgi:hypothetical protein
MVLVFGIVMFLAILDGSTFGQRIHARAAETRKRMHTLQHSAPTVYPYILNTTLITVDGTRRPCRVEAYRDHLQILGGHPTSILALLQWPEVTSVMYQDRSKEGLPMAGLGLNTSRGQYFFFSEGFTAPHTMKQAGWKIQSIYREQTGRQLDSTDRSIGVLTADNIVHNL